ncbi:MAG: helix-turn-helix domain-containing protein [Micromonosporaceae bacterium]
MPRRHVVDPRFAAELRRLRKARSLSLRDLAGLAYVAKSTISELENGQKSPTPESAQALDRALQAKGALAELVTETTPAASNPVMPWETAELLERVRASDVSAATVEALHATVFELCCAYGWQDARRLRGEGLRWLREVERLLRRPVGLRRHQDLLIVAGWLALLVGCIEYDLELPPAAEATRAAALELAREGGSNEIATWAWEMSAWFALTQGRYRDVVTAAEAGQHIIGEHTAAVQLLGQEAKALARVGDVRGVRSALERGRALLDRFPPPSRPDHHFVVDPDKWDFYAMDAYRIVGEDALAHHHAEQVLILGTAPDGTEKAPMRMAEARLTLGKVAARADDLEHAAAVAVEAFQAKRRSLPQLLMVAHEVGEELCRRDPKGWPARDFREAVRAVSAE